ncbi:autotransporter outer membrane beta-barrel domain-containing protein [Paraburkholderia humisilvae]|uniref:Autotransporter domain-containing protein n=1 Tax=Paraburkholderia humisilvae TaxID=627669 RepID=A0A6J5F7X7_9BURK|nr:autotransporter outer membrane beta-barrel domain-containing protein [Paraburkholderia humisilvae]CAB3774604.1 hypothetical protein LMG29542_07982 [Paraburkholderia humisilvae]
MISRITNRRTLLRERCSVMKPSAGWLAALAYIATIPSLSFANCTTVNNSTTCDTSVPSPWSRTIGAGPGTASGSTVTVGANARVAMGDATAIALSDNATIVVQSGAQVTNSARVNDGTYGTGANTIEFRNNSTLTVEQGAAVISGGTESIAEAVNPLGTGNAIVNNGTIQGVNSAAIWFENTTGSNTVINNATGLIEAPGSVMGASGNGAVDFTNRGRVIGSLDFAGGNDALRLYTGSSVSGSIDGGGGNNILTLNGAGTGMLANVTNFQTLQKQDSGIWTIGDSIRTMGVSSAEVRQGTLVLTGDNSEYTGTMLVDQEGILQGTSRSLPQAITDNGSVKFAQASDGSYAGVVSGTGSVEKDGTGKLVLLGGNTYTGGTVLTQGVLSVSADSALGGKTGGVTFNGGTLQLGSSFDLASTRALLVAAGGGTIDTQGFQSTIAQDLRGTGALFKTGAGTLTIGGSLVGSLTAEVQQGTLVLNGRSAQHTGSVTVDAHAALQASSHSLPWTVTNNGLMQFQQDADGTYGGLISGTGVVEKGGLGTLTLSPGSATGNTYTGGTMLKQGVLSVAADNALGGAAGGVTFDGGTLQLGNSFNPAGTRAISIAAGGGTIDTQAFVSAITQNITGTGALTKVGAGTLVLNGVNSWLGGTTVSAGALGIGDASATTASITAGASVAAGATLGGYGTVNGDVTNKGTVAVADALVQFAGGAHGNFTINGTLTNANLVQIGGGQNAGNSLVVNRYIGNDGVIALNTVLAGDSAASDKLVVNGGRATGATTLKVRNVGGQGALVASNGIEVVAATNGATTDAGAFSLAGGTVKAGAYEYYLAKGGVTPGTSENFYLRNTVLADPNGGGTTAAPGTPALPVTDSAPVTLFRPEVALYAELPSVARQLGMMQIDSFHLRQGEQSLLGETGPLPAAWGRVWGGHSTLSQDGDVVPRFSGSMTGTQIGQDLYASTTPSGHRNHYGLLLGFGRATGDVRGYAVGVPDTEVGHLGVSAYSVGGYWTHIGPGGWYSDAVVLGSALEIDSSSRDGISSTTHGKAVTGSVEGGVPFAVGRSLTLEPQAQFIWQHQTIRDLNDGISNVTFSNGNTMVGRLGVRLAGVYEAVHVFWQPYLRFSLLRSFGGSDKATFGGVTPISTSVGQTTGQVDAGMVAKLTKHGSAFATVSVSTNLGSEHQRIVTGNVGARWAW